MLASRLFLLVGLAALTTSASAQRPSIDAFREADAARTDTLRYDVRAGEPLIVALPGRVRGIPVRYALDEAPALSWLVDRSFFWQTRSGERGDQAVRLRRIAEDREEIVVLLVEVTP